MLIISFNIKFSTISHKSSVMIIARSVGKVYSRPGAAKFVEMQNGQVAGDFIELVLIGKQYAYVYRPVGIITNKLQPVNQPRYNIFYNVLFGK